jgi:hypothetical protein
MTEFTKFTVVFRPFLNSDVTATIALNGVDEDDVIKAFRALQPFAQLVSVEEA